MGKLKEAHANNDKISAVRIGKAYLAGTAKEVWVPDAKTQDWVRAHDAEVRDVVITTLERQTLDQLTQPGARDSVKRALTVALQPVAGTTDLRVYLPQFVIQ